MTNEELQKEITLFKADEFVSKDTIDVKRVYIDMVGGDLTTGVLFSQIIYFNLEDSKGNDTKLRVKRNDNLWLAKGRDDWYNECRITPAEFDRAIKILTGEYTKKVKIDGVESFVPLIDKPLVEKKIYKFAGNPMTHIRILWENFLPAYNNAKQNSFLRKHEKRYSGNLNNDTKETLICITQTTTQNNTENTNNSTDFDKSVGTESPEAVQEELFQSVRVIGNDRVKKERGRPTRQFDTEHLFELDYLKGLKWPALAIWRAAYGESKGNLIPASKSTLQNFYNKMDDPIEFQVLLLRFANNGKGPSGRNVDYFIDWVEQGARIGPKYKQPSAPQPELRNSDGLTYNDFLAQQLSGKIDRHAEWHAEG